MGGCCKPAAASVAQPSGASTRGSTVGFHRARRWRPSAPPQAIDRRERLRRLALETIDLSKDPYFMRNHLGQYECRLCLTLHNNEGNYLAHTQGEWVCWAWADGQGRRAGAAWGTHFSCNTCRVLAWKRGLGQFVAQLLACGLAGGPARVLGQQGRAMAQCCCCSSGLTHTEPACCVAAGKRHQQNLAKRAAREAAEKPVLPAPQRRATVKRSVKIGRPGYRVTKQFDPEAGSRSLLFQVRGRWLGAGRWLDGAGSVLTGGGCARCGIGGGSDVSTAATAAD